MLRKGEFHFPGYNWVYNIAFGVPDVVSKIFEALDIVTIANIYSINHLISSIYKEELTFYRNLLFKDNLTDNWWRYVNPSYGAFYGTIYLKNSKPIFCYKSLDSDTISGLLQKIYTSYELKQAPINWNFLSINSFSGLLLTSPVFRDIYKEYTTFSGPSSNYQVPKYYKLALKLKKKYLTTFSVQEFVILTGNNVDWLSFCLHWNKVYESQDRPDVEIPSFTSIWTIEHKDLMDEQLKAFIKLSHGSPIRMEQQLFKLPPPYEVFERPEDWKINLKEKLLKEKIARIQSENQRMILEDEKNWTLYEEEAVKLLNEINMVDPSDYWQYKKGLRLMYLGTKLGRTDYKDKGRVFFQTCCGKFL